jgi:hypothetical protein
MLLVIQDFFKHVHLGFHAILAMHITYTNVLSKSTFTSPIILTPPNSYPIIFKEPNVELNFVRGN